jgi:hypothetical protein
MILESQHRSNLRIYIPKLDHYDTIISHQGCGVGTQKLRLRLLDF